MIRLVTGVKKIAVSAEDKTTPRAVTTDRRAVWAVHVAFRQVASPRLCALRDMVVVGA